MCPVFVLRRMSFRNLVEFPVMGEIPRAGEPVHVVSLLVVIEQSILLAQIDSLLPARKLRKVPARPGTKSIVDCTVVSCFLPMWSRALVGNLTLRQRLFTALSPPLIRPRMLTYSAPHHQYCFLYDEGFVPDGERASGCPTPSQ